MCCLVVVISLRLEHVRDLRHKWVIWGKVNAVSVSTEPGLGSVNSEQIESSTFEIVSAGLH